MSLRPLGIPTFEDKVLQRAVAMVLEAVYEQDFLSCSYGFRPGARRIKPWRRWYWLRATMRWVMDLDIEKYFDSDIDPQLRAFLDRRLRMVSSAG